MCDTTSEIKKKKKKKKRSRSRKRITPEQILASKEIHNWAFPEANDHDHDALLPKVLFELHSHSTCSDGFLSPNALVERAHARGVNVLALTDHDTMAGIPEAVEAAQKFGIRIIPGVEISTIFHPREGSGCEEPVHILAYYSSFGPSNYDKLELFLSNIREGRYHRAKNMLIKLNKLKMPLKWEQVAKMAGDGVAPGRLHVARAMVEAGHVQNLKEAFSRYLYDGGPAYDIGSEPPAEDAIRLICDTGGVAVLAHPWSLKNSVAIISSLKNIGLHAVEAYRSDGKLSAFSDLCDTYELLKLGGTDYHGRGGPDEYDIGSVSLPVLAVHEFLTFSRPIWCNAIKDIIAELTNESSDRNLTMITRFWKRKDIKSASLECITDIVDSCLSSWLTNEEKKTFELVCLQSKFSNMTVFKATMSSFQAANS